MLTVRSITRTFDVEERSPLFQLVDGESVAISYNPKNPKEFYYRDLLKSRVHLFGRGVLIAIAFIAIVFIGVWLRSLGRR